ncbi:MAG: hypothetical protein AAGL89_11605 [Pseudomonadota bacterium]
MATKTAEAESKDMSAVRTPEHKMRMRIGRTIGRGVWEAGYKVEFPEATKDERKAAWEAARKDFTKIGLRALKTLEKTGFDVVKKDSE